MYLSNLHFAHFIPDLINLIFFLISLTYFYIKYYIKKNTIIILFIFLLTPFLFYFLFPWYIHPDQSKYAGTIFSFRDFSYDKSISSLLTTRLDFSSFLYALFPVPFVSTIISVGLINKAMLYVLILYFLNKKKYFLTNLLLFLPSIIFFSSVALREMLVISIGIAFVYLFFEKKNYIQSFFFAVLLLLIKPHFGILLLIISVAYYFFFIKLNLNVLNKIALGSFIVSAIFLFIVIFILKDQLISSRNGFFTEDFGYALIVRDESITIFSILSSFTQFLFSPLSTKELNLWNIVIFIENLFLLYVVVILLNKIYKENKCKAIFWALTLLFLFTIFGFVIFNAGTIWRYKFVVQIVIISAIYFSLNIKNRYINLL
jgi:hypothetical protein